MPHMPCYADLAARDYAHQASIDDARDKAVAEQVEQLETLSHSELDRLLTQSERDELATFLFEVASRMIDANAHTPDEPTDVDGWGFF